MTLIEMQAARAAAVAEARSIVDEAETMKRDTDEERAAADAKMAEADAKLAEAKDLKGQIERRQTIENAEADLATSTRALPHDDPAASPGEHRIETPVYRGALRSFRSDPSISRADALLNAYTSGQFLLSMLRDQDGARAWCREHGVERRTLVTDVNTGAGFLIPAPMETAIINLRATYGVARKLAKIRPMSADTLSINRNTSDVTAYAINEAGSITESEPAYDRVTLIAKKWGAMTRSSNELSADAVISLADEIASSHARAHAKKEDECFFDGTGAGTYHGIYGIEAWFNANTSAKGYIDAASAHDTFAEVDADDLGGCIGGVRPREAMLNPKWVCSPEFKAVVFDALGGAAGGATMAEVAGRRFPTYAGYEIVETILLPSSGTNNQVMCLFGDFTLSSSIGDRQGITIKADESVYFATDEIAWRSTARSDINHHDLGDTTTAGPVVALIANT